jgi:hypothetical protein
MVPATLLIQQQNPSSRHETELRAAHDAQGLISQTVESGDRVPGAGQHLWILRCSYVGFSRAIRRISALIEAAIQY